jgi:hypothetical protein
MQEGQQGGGEVNSRRAMDQSNLELLFLFSRPSLASSFKIVSHHSGQHIGSLLTTHHSCAAVRPSKHKSWIVCTATHSVISSAIGASNHQGDFGNLKRSTDFVRRRATFAEATAVTSFAPFLAIPSFSYFLPIMKPVIFWTKRIGTFRCAQSSIKCAPYKQGRIISFLSRDKERIKTNLEGRLGE